METSGSTHRRQHRQPEQPHALFRFAHEYGWWRVVAIPIMVVITVWVIVDIARGESVPEETRTPTSAAAPTSEERIGPDPAAADAVRLSIDELPPGGPFTEAGDGTFREVGSPGAHFGQGGKQVVRYALEIENGIDTAAFGGDQAFAALVDATLGDPRGWTATGDYEFQHVAANDNPDTTIQLTSVATTAELCGAQLQTETSCHTTITGDSTVVLNESRWVRGSASFEGDVGNYRQYLINHEFGHAIGYASHQACGGQGQLAPIMMQQTLSLNNAELYEQDSKEIYPNEDITCEPNPWPYPTPASQDPHNPA